MSTNFHFVVKAAPREHFLVEIDSGTMQDIQFAFQCVRDMHEGNDQITARKYDLLNIAWGNMRDNS